MLKFGSADPPKLTKNTLESVAVDTFIKYLHQLIRADAFDDSVIINLIDSETVGLLTYYFQPTETSDYSSLDDRSFRLWRNSTRSSRSIDISIMVLDGCKW